MPKICNVMCETLLCSGQFMRLQLKKNICATHKKVNGHKSFKFKV